MSKQKTKGLCLLLIFNSLDNTEIDYKNPTKIQSQPTMARMTSINTALDVNAFEKESNREEGDGLPANFSDSQRSKNDVVCRI
jgi:hypothetical protein